MKKRVEEKFGDMYKYMDELVGFIKQHDNFYNYNRKEKNEYVNKFLIDDHFNEKVPEEWRVPLLETSIPDLIDMAKNGSIKDHFPESLKSFIRQCNNLQLQDIETTFHEKLDIKLLNKFQLKKKKLHELERLGKLVLDLLKNNPNISTILDLGCGKGYLTSLVGFHHPNIEIIGIDNNPERIKEFSQRKKKLEFRIRKLQEQEEEEEEREEIEGEETEKKKKKKQKEEKEDKKGEELDNVKLVIKNLTLTNLSELDEHLKEGNALILGLHACGDLSPYCLKVFRHSQKIQALVIVSCCYFKMSESYGFPLSEYVRQKFFNDGYDPQSLAIGCFAPKTWTVKNSIPQFRFRSFRFALEALLYDANLRTEESRAKFNGRKPPKGIDDFPSYIKWSFEKIIENYPDREIDFRNFLERDDFEEFTTEFYTKKIRTVGRRRRIF